MGQKFENSATAVLVLCAMAMTTLAARTQFVGRRAPQAPSVPNPTPAVFRDWRSFASAGHRIGPADARVTILEFVDYECPACRATSSILSQEVERAQQENPNQIAMVFVHFPLYIHRFAMVAAQAVECAGDQDRFTDMQQMLFAKQDSFGLKPWSQYAQEAGIKDSAQFTHCMRDSTASRRVRDGLALAQKLQLSGTPTILVNGWTVHLGMGDAEHQLRTAINRSMKGMPAVDTSANRISSSNRSTPGEVHKDSVLQFAVVARGN